MDPESVHFASDGPFTGFLHSDNMEYDHYGHGSPRVSQPLHHSQLQQHDPRYNGGDGQQNQQQLAQGEQSNGVSDDGSRSLVQSPTSPLSPPHDGRMQLYNPHLPQQAQQPQQLSNIFQASFQQQQQQQQLQPTGPWDLASSTQALPPVANFGQHLGSSANSGIQLPPTFMALLQQQQQMMQQQIQQQMQHHQQQMQRQMMEFQRMFNQQQHSGIALQPSSPSVQIQQQSLISPLYPCAKQEPFDDIIFKTTSDFEHYPDRGAAGYPIPKKAGVSKFTLDQIMRKELHRKAELARRRPEEIPNYHNGVEITMLEFTKLSPTSQRYWTLGIDARKADTDPKLRTKIIAEIRKRRANIRKAYDICWGEHAVDLRAYSSLQDMKDDLAEQVQYAMLVYMQDSFGIPLKYGRQEVASLIESQYRNNKQFSDAKQEEEQMEAALVVEKAERELQDNLKKAPNSTLPAKRKKAAKTTPSNKKTRGSEQNDFVDEEEADLVVEVAPIAVDKTGGGNDPKKSIADEEETEPEVEIYNGITADKTDVEPDEQMEKDEDEEEELARFMEEQKRQFLLKKQNRAKPKPSSTPARQESARSKSPPSSPPPYPRNVVQPTRNSTTISVVIHSSSQSGPSKPSELSQPSPVVSKEGSLSTVDESNAVEKTREETPAKSTEKTGDADKIAERQSGEETREETPVKVAEKTEIQPGESGQRGGADSSVTPMPQPEKPVEPETEKGGVASTEVCTNKQAEAPVAVSSSPTVAPLPQPSSHPPAPPTSATPKTRQRAAAAPKKTPAATKTAKRKTVRAKLNGNEIPDLSLTESVEELYAQLELDPSTPVVFEHTKSLGTKDLSPENLHIVFQAVGRAQVRFTTLATGSRTKKPSPKEADNNAQKAEAREEGLKQTKKAEANKAQKESAEELRKALMGL